MRVLHINTHAEGGAAIAVKRLHLALLDAGVESRLLTLYRIDEDIPETYCFQDFGSLFRKLFTSIHYRLLHRFSPFRSVSSPVSPFRIEKHPLITWSDVINLHWVANFLNFKTFFSHPDVSTKPIVWRFPDQYPIRGIVHYDRDLVASNMDLEEKAREMKLESIKSHTCIIPVATSKWLHQEINQSGIFGNSDIPIIGNALDFDTLPSDLPREHACEQMGWENTTKKLLFVANDLANPTKGLALLNEILDELEDVELKLILVGKNFKPRSYPANINVINMGMIADEEKLFAIYSACDLYITTSLAEAFGQTVLEAIAIGKPVVSFRVGGIPDMVVHESNGFLPEPGDLVKMRTYIKKILLDPKLARDFGTFSSKHARKHFSKEIQAEKYIQVYEKVLP